MDWYESLYFGPGNKANIPLNITHSLKMLAITLNMHLCKLQLPTSIPCTPLHRTVILVVWYVYIYYCIVLIFLCLVLYPSLFSGSCINFMFGNIVCTFYTVEWFDNCSAFVNCNCWQGYSHLGVNTRKHRDSQSYLHMGWEVYMYT